MKIILSATLTNSEEDIFYRKLEPAYHGHIIRDVSGSAGTVNEEIVLYPFVENSKDYIAHLRKTIWRKR